MMLSKKIILPTAIILVVVIIVVGVWLISRNGGQQMNIVNPYSLDTLFAFNVKDKSLTPAKIDEYFKTFTDNKNIILSSPEQFNFQGFMTVGIIKKLIGDLAGARDVWTYVSLKRPENSLSFGNLGDLYANFLNDPLQAEENLKIAVNNSKGESFNLNYCRNLYDLYTYYLPDKKILRENVLLDCLKDNAESADLYALLGGYYIEINEKERALEAYEKVLEIDPGRDEIKKEIKKLK